MITLKVQIQIEPRFLITLLHSLLQHRYQISNQVFDSNEVGPILPCKDRKKRCARSELQNIEQAPSLITELYYIDDYRRKVSNPLL